jgi:SAM-dependent methyltransferase
MFKVISRFRTVWKKIIWQVDIPFQFSDIDSVHVDLGAGNIPRNPFGAHKVIATDFHLPREPLGNLEFVQVDLTTTLPFSDNSISSISAYDVLEHIPRWERTETGIGFPFIFLMNEIHRVLIPGGIFIAVTPAFPNDEAFKDPTHVNLIAKSTIQYFVEPEPWARLLGYGYTGSFSVEAQCWLRGAGPYSQRSLLWGWREKNVKSKLRTWWVLFWRILFLKKSKKSTPLLWVLIKENSK